MLQAFPATVLFMAIICQIHLVSCTATSNGSYKPNQQSRATTASLGVGSDLSAEAREKIGNKIWQNESGGSFNGLTHWNTGEEFPSMGIGHFIWYPKNFQGRWTESFPLFIAYANQQHPGSVPAWLIKSRHCPWPNKTSFFRDFEGPRLRELRSWLASNISLQTDFIIKTSREALPNIMRHAPYDSKQRIKTNYQKVSTTANGTYALIDYVNFKGDGTNPGERYNNQGWGLMWVLIEMRDVASGKAAASEFSAAAKRCLDRRIKNSPKSRGENRWRAGWHNRCDSYKKPL